ncbi:MAG: hypothetical protein CVV42_01270 [Candidatus Riflebacteria bacterium HGW-Riflebacteria-2]|jgi:type II secretory pathway pseudopilin PulG|nr:MAG: hypothetical protein CVV42_01270 [Candidatus Riflebacteria bacterium HGW-Riflebacteria-2]
MYSWFSTGRNCPQRQRAGVTLVEILIVTVIITLMAAVSFPVYKIIQQREKEKRLRKILASVRSALSGSKSPLSAREFVEGYRTYVIAYGSYLIENALEPPGANTIPAGQKKKVKENFLKLANNEGFGYPESPQKLVQGNILLKIDVPTGSSGVNATYTVTIPVDRRFVRNIPPHPFIGWVPNARFEFKAAVNTSGSPTLPFNSAAWGTTASGVTDIVSRGAGLALNGSRTDDW